MTFRDATVDDLPQIVRLLADDPLGATRETPGEDIPEAYFSAFAAIDKDPNNTVVVAEAGGRVAGTLQLTFIPGLTYTGGERAQIEGVRVAAEYRGAGLGQQMINWAIDRARARGCRVVQLTTDRQRPDAIRFYQKIGFRPSHMGMKYHLT
ncbi:MULTISPECIES: GNAT family N-acetyltransferase [Actinomadura]|uniref:Ribosomal protein S18 acetylase RimI n=1 Tax=Actinomadura madurae TaxID=1993 RepID=A0A1I5U3V2_9ACTN|nr:GNAT family N-acetyltransferase [Actinomadura madurae]MCP9951852.1 GNAT family N-acetyltransferase [Actinomadura madurae]MCP9981096.1 GNAT family N-acetyltransferase [Actinomadura madurae]MCQ0007405.1 GNAT family N-acetyltransferase [Actinomadura madurae]MCQ0017294.1 GNAT family N-acetyltransferase [Actinomadura madurae]URM97103.1 GNAT family N-acetyltransferase [Actinomadura madurae]